MASDCPVFLQASCSCHLLPRGSAPRTPGRGAASALRKARAALTGASRPLTRRSKRLMGEWRLRGYPSFVRRKGIFSKPSRNGLPARRLPTSRKSWGGGGPGEETLLQKGFLPPPPACRASTLPHLKEPRCRMASNAGPFPESSHGTAGLWAAGCPCAWTPRNRSAEREKPD